MSQQWQRVPFADLLVDSRDGEWGEGAQSIGLQACDLIRGTDFSSISDRDVSLPLRWIPDRLVERKKLQADDIVFEMAGGTAKQSTGRSAFVGRSFLEGRERPVLCASFCRHLRLDRERFEPRFIYYLLQALYGSGYMGVFNIQHTGVSRFQYTSFKKHTELRIPYLPEQRRIAAFIVAYDDLIENNRRRIALLERMAEQLYREWFVRFRFPGYQQAKFVKGIPAEWNIRGLGELGTYLNGYAFKPSDWFAEGTPIIKIKEMSGGVTADTPRNPGETIPKKYHFEDGDIIFSWSGTLSVLVWDQGAGLLNQHLFKVVPTSGVPSSYLYFSIKTSIPWFESLATGATMQHIKRKELDQVKVSLPSDDLLAEFDRHVAPMLTAKIELAKANRLLVASRDLLLPRLISGKLRVDHLDIQFPPSMQTERA